MIVYRKSSGRASDLRFVPADYQLAADELVLTPQAWPNQDALPELASLHDAAIVKADEVATQRAAVDAQIRELELRQARSLREIALGMTTAGGDGKTPAQRLAALEAQIAALRSSRP